MKEAVEEFFEKMTIVISNMEVNLSSIKKNLQDAQDIVEENRDVVDLDIKLNEPQILIGQQGQTLFEIQRLLRTVLNKKLQKVFYLNLDINDYKKKKIEYLKDIAKELADQVSLTKEEKALLPMSAYERRIIHSELSQRTDVITESHGDGFERHIVIKPR
ncbi:MAG: R3H domain-containing nucleic acid-binding protein [Ignavibacteria bacterium]|nr:R3H domain-containing nucleic acid-binding protein [Ignavibacteria bacterium]